MWGIWLCLRATIDHSQLQTGTTAERVTQIHTVPIHSSRQILTAQSQASSDLLPRSEVLGTP